MNTAHHAIDFAASKLLPSAVAALLVVGSPSAQARVLSQAGDVLMQDLTPVSVTPVSDPDFRCVAQQFCNP